jgi:hypothetical protein
MRASKRLEQHLEERYQASGSGLGERARSIRNRLTPDLYDAIELVARVRNVLAHDVLSDTVSNEPDFRDALATIDAQLGLQLLHFFDEVEEMHSGGDPSDSWIEAYPISFLGRLVNRTLASTQERRLFISGEGLTRLFPPGTHQPLRGTWGQADYYGWATLSARSLPIPSVVHHTLNSVEVRVRGSAVVRLRDDSSAIALMIAEGNTQVDLATQLIVDRLRNVVASGDDVELAKSARDKIQAQIVNEYRAMSAKAQLALELVSVSLDSVAFATQPETAAIELAKTAQATLIGVAKAESAAQVAKETAALRLQSKQDELTELAIDVQLTELRAKVEVAAAQGKIAIDQQVAVNELERIRQLSLLLTTRAGQRAAYPEHTFELERKEIEVRAKQEAELRNLMLRLAQVSLQAGEQTGAYKTARALIEQRTGVDLRIDGLEGGAIAGIEVPLQTAATTIKPLKEPTGEAASSGSNSTVDDAVD